MNKLILLRHGQSQWNLENRFTGWTDIPLTDIGISEAIKAGKLLKKHNIKIDTVFSSILKRANKTAEISLKEAEMKETSHEGNILITVKDEQSQEKTNISLPCLYDISSEVIENIKAVEGVFEIQAK